VASWWSWYHKLPIKKCKKKIVLFLFKGQGTPSEVKGHKGAPLVAEGCGSLLIMPSRSTNLVSFLYTIFNLTIQAGFTNFWAFVPFLGDVRFQTFLWWKMTHVRLWYAMTGWHKAFRIINGEHLKMRLNVLETQMCMNFGNLGFDYSIARHISWCDIELCFNQWLFV
jgi:hypothetical protein